MATLTTNINYLQATSFKLLVDRKHYPNLEFFCQSVSHPGMTMSAVETPFRKAAIPLPGDTLVFGELSCQLILDEDMNIKWISKGWNEQTIKRLIEDVLIN